jgi:hypothetical protein
MCNKYKYAVIILENPILSFPHNVLFVAYFTTLSVANLYTIEPVGWQINWK